MEVVGEMVGIVDQVWDVRVFKCVIKNLCCSLRRKLMMLFPFLQELRDRTQTQHYHLKPLLSLKQPLLMALDLLRFGCLGSKLYIVLERENIENKFKELSAHFEQALSEILVHNFDISEEVKEQVELVHSQFKRAKDQLHALDSKLCHDLMSIYNHSNEVDTDPAVVYTLCENLGFLKLEDLKQESLALQEMVLHRQGDPGETVKKMSLVLKKFEDSMREKYADICAFANTNCYSHCSCQAYLNQFSRSPIIPDDFLCPISMELMKNPVIICTGQTYDRACIKKWLETGHRTCPKTRQTLSNTTLIPNFVLLGIISRWCEANDIELTTKLCIKHQGETGCAGCVRILELDALLRKLSSSNMDDQRSAAGELRLLAKHNGCNRVLIGEAGAIPLLVALLYSPDTTTQELAITALLNLSIYDGNKGYMMSTETVPGILHVLKNGSMEARENAAAAFFSLSVVDEYKVRIGASGAIPALVTLLGEGSQRGRVDAATALFNLCIYHGNKGHAVRAGIVPLLMTLLTESGGQMVDEALAILAILANNPDGKAAIGALNIMPSLVDLVRNGSPRNKESAAAMLVHICAANSHHLLDANSLGIISPLLDMVDNGTERGKRKAARLLELIVSHSKPS